MSAEIFDLVSRFGLPLVMFFGVIYLSLSGKVMWRPAYDALVAAMSDRIVATEKNAERDRLEKELYRDELLQMKRDLERGVKLTERVERATRRTS